MVRCMLRPSLGARGLAHAEGAVGGEGVELRGESEVEVERAIVAGGQEVRWHDPWSRRPVRRR